MQTTIATTHIVWWIATINQVKGGLDLKPTKLEHIFVAVITFPLFLLSRGPSTNLLTLDVVLHFSSAAKL